MARRAIVVFSSVGTTDDAEPAEALLGVVPHAKALARVSREIRARYGTPPWGAEHDVPWYGTNRRPGQVHVVVSCDPERAVGRAVFDDRAEAEAFVAQERDDGDEVCLVTVTMGVMDYSRFGIGGRCP